MDYYDALERSLLAGIDEIWRNISVMPKDKVDWKPAETSRSAHELLGELVSTVEFATEVLKSKCPSPEAYVSHVDEGVKSLERLHRSAITGFITQVKAFNVAELEEKIELPWGTMPYFDLISYIYWNTMYHLGQINYIQTLYGDAAFH